MSGFLVIIYVAGRSLTRFQIVAACVTYYVWAITHLGATIAYGQELAVVQEEIRAIAPQFVIAYAGNSPGLVITILIWSATLILRGLFAWQIRREVRAA